MPFASIWIAVPCYSTIPGSGLPMTSTVSHRPTLCLALLLVTGLVPSMPSVAATKDTADRPQDTTVTLYLTDGTSLTAPIEPSGDGDYLWLRWKRGRAVLKRSIPWGRIARADADGEQLSRDQLQQLVDRLRAQGADEAGAVRRIVTVSRPKMIGTTAPAGTATPSTEPRVRSLSVEAHVANFDADAEVDGLVLEITPVGDDGRTVPVDAAVHVELIGQQARLALRRGQSYYRLGYWSRRVRPEDFGPYGATFRLPFQQVHPDFNTNVAPKAAVHVRLSVPGQGTFEATDSMVRIRPYSVVRDRYQMRTGHRFFPQERTDDGRR